jgi:hypothetical protein
MKTQATAITLTFDEQNNPQCTLALTCSRKQAQMYLAELREVLTKGHQLSVEIKQWRQRRSLDANAYLWVILNEMASAIGTSKDELYLEMLSRYGVFTHVVVKPNVAERVKQEWRTCRELGEVTVNGKSGIQLQCFFGSSTYDSKEFSTLLNGVISEAKELGIDTISESEKQRLLSGWGK